MPDQKAFTNKIVLAIQDINGNPALSGAEKMEAIKNLQGAPKEDMYEYLNNNFRTGPGLSPFLSKYVSRGRPRGAPKDSAKGIKD